jgi:hypothetical protein
MTFQLSLEIFVLFSVSFCTTTTNNNNNNNRIILYNELALGHELALGQYSS